MKTAAAFALSLLVAVPFVSAHGYVGTLTVDGKAYKGNTPNNNKVQSPIRMISDVNPVKGATNKFLSCGQNAQKAPLVADAKPGSTVSFQWVNGQGGNWPHNVGPLMTYMASCGSAGCANFDSSKAQWFKIAEAGLQKDGTWAQAALMQGKPAVVQLPSNIAPGEYLIRHEIIALHTAMTLGGAEFYPSCSQLKVSGSATGKPNQTVSFPGAYKDTDPGILVDVYDLKGAYVYPGPAISNLAGKTILAVNGTQTTVAASKAASTSSHASSSSAHASSSSHASSSTHASTSSHAASTSLHSSSTTSHAAAASVKAAVSTSVKAAVTAVATSSKASATTSAAAAASSSDEYDCEDEEEETTTQQHARRYSRVMAAIL